ATCSACCPPSSSIIRFSLPWWERARERGRFLSPPVWCPCTPLSLTFSPLWERGLSDSSLRSSFPFTLGSSLPWWERVRERGRSAFPPPYQVQVLSPLRGRESERGGHNSTPPPHRNNSSCACPGFCPASRIISGQLCTSPL